MKKKYLFLFILCSICILSFGQKYYQDVVYLKDGSIIKGIIIEQVPYKYIKIETADKSVFVFQMYKIKKIDKEIIEIKNNRTSNFSFKSSQKKRKMLSDNKTYSNENEIYNSESALQLGYRRIIELGTIGGSGFLSYRNGLKISLINTYQFTPLFSLGVGTGLEQNFGNNITNYTALPIFADFRARFINKKVSPYISLGIGSIFDLNKDNGSFFLNPIFGISFKVSSNSVMNVGLGYERLGHFRNYEYYYYGYYYTNEEFSERVIFNIGVSF